MELTPVYIEARDIPDAWFQCIDLLLEKGFKYKIQHGSYVGDMRLEFDWVTVHIRYPQTRPLEPDIPPHLGIPNPVEPGYIDEYLSYLMTPAKEEQEDYTYGERISGYSWYDVEFHGNFPLIHKRTINQIEHFIELLSDTPNTNQAILQVAAPTDCLLGDPPCLRHVDMKVKDGKLIFYPYFRSWDLWGGFPANLGGLVLLQEYMAESIGIKPGPFICNSKGMHLYKYVWELSKLRTGR